MCIWGKHFRLGSWSEPAEFSSSKGRQESIELCKGLIWEHGFIFKTKETNSASSVLFLENNFLKLLAVIISASYSPLSNTLTKFLLLLSTIAVAGMDKVSLKENCRRGTQMGMNTTKYILNCPLYMKACFVCYGDDRSILASPMILLVTWDSCVRLEIWLNQSRPIGFIQPDLISWPNSPGHIQLYLMENNFFQLVKLIS